MTEIVLKETDFKTRHNDIQGDFLPNRENVGHLVLSRMDSSGKRSYWTVVVKLEHEETERRHMFQYSKDAFTMARKYVL